MQMTVGAITWNVFASIRVLSKVKRKQKGSNSFVKEVIEIKRETLKVEAVLKGRR